MAQRHETERSCRAVVRGLLVVGAAALALSGCARAPEPALGEGPGRMTVLSSDNIVRCSSTGRTRHAVIDTP